MRGLPRLQSGDLGVGGRSTRLFELAHRRAAQREQHLRGIPHIDAVVVEAGKRSISKLDRVVRRHGLRAARGEAQSYKSGDLRTSCSISRASRWISTISSALGIRSASVNGTGLTA